MIRRVKSSSNNQLNTWPSSLNLCGEWIEKFKKDYFDRGGSETTWKAEYQKVLKFLPKDEPLTAELLHDLVINTNANSRTRVRYVMVASQFAKFADLDYDPTPYKGKYRTSCIKDVPSDSKIVEVWQSIKRPEWRWVFGVMAIYGLRNHEVFRLDYTGFKGDGMAIQVLTGKTGYRLVFPFHPQWFSAFNLSEVRLPKVNVERSNEAVGHSVTEWFSDHNIPFAPYDLRHAYAVRTLSYGVDPSMAARYMGHSRDVHEHIYRRWVDAVMLKAEYERATGNSHRCKPSVPLP